MASLSAIAITVAPKVATSALSVGLVWIKGYANESYVQEAIQNNPITLSNKTSFNERKVSRHKTLSEAVTKQLEAIQEGINILRNDHFHSAQDLFKEAIEHNDDPDEFKYFIQETYTECIKAKSTIVEAYDKICLYSLIIASGFIRFSKYGENYKKGLKHIYKALVNMNNDGKLRQNVGAALGAHCYWTKNDKKLVQSVIYFAVRTRAFIEEIKYCIRQSLIYNNMEELEGNDEKQQEYHHHHVLSKTASLFPKKSKSESSDDVMITAILENVDWIPDYQNGYYFGNVGEESCKYSILQWGDFNNVMNMKYDNSSLKIDEDVYVRSPPRKHDKPLFFGWCCCGDD